MTTKTESIFSPSAHPCASDVITILTYVLMDNYCKSGPVCSGTSESMQVLPNS